MKRFHWLTALAVLFCASVSLADNLPPVPEVPNPDVCESSLPPVSTIKVVAEDAQDAGSRRCNLRDDTEDTRRSLRDRADGLFDRRPVEHTACFVSNALLRRPIYDIQEAMYDLEGRRLDREADRLARETRRLSEEAQVLSKRTEKADTSLLSKLELLQDQSRYAEKANRLAVEKAKFDVKKADHAARRETLDAKRARFRQE